MPERTLNATGPQAWFDSFFAISLWGLSLLFSAGLGVRLLRNFKHLSLTRSDNLVFGLALGFGVLGGGTLLLGLLGWLTPARLTIWLIIVAIAGSRVWSEWLQVYTDRPKIESWWRNLPWGYRLIVLLTGSIFALSAIQALTPPWNYDGLMYHLRGPQIFIESRQIKFIANPWAANYPFNTEMLYTIGLMYHSTGLARLMHLSFAALTLLTTYKLGKSVGGATVGWLSAAVLLGIPMFPIWASLSYIDMAWTFYETLALYGLVRWQQSKQQANWLILAGIALGLALGSKYLALGWAAILGLYVLWQSRGSGWVPALKTSLGFGAIAGFIAAPWYLKNLLFTGNPIFPLFFGGPGWGTAQLAALTAHHNIYGSGRTWLDYLLLPLRLYTQRAQFSTFLGSLAMPSLLFPLAFLYPFIAGRLKAKPRAVLNGLAILALLRFGWWAVGPQHVRLLLPLFPLLSVLATVVLVYGSQRLLKASTARLVSQGIAIAVLLTTFIYATIWFVSQNPLLVVSGQQSKADFLTAHIASFAATQMIETTFADDERALLLWDGQGYYCPQHCIADMEPTRWPLLLAQNLSLSEMAMTLKNDGLTHILLNNQSSPFFTLTDHTAYQHLWAEFIPVCTDLVYQDTIVSLFKITCSE